jgi:hypothetical protein
MVRSAEVEAGRNCGMSSCLRKEVRSSGYVSTRIESHGTGESGGIERLGKKVVSERDRGISKSKVEEMARF